MKPLSYIYMILAAILLGGIGVLIKLVGDAVPMMSLSFFRIFFGFLFLLIIVPFIDKTWYVLKKRDYGDYFIIGLIFAISLSLYTAANLFAPIQNVVLINYSYPFFVLLFGYFLLRERITKTKIITLLIAAAGLIIINPFQFGAHAIGNVLSLIGAFFYGLLITEMRKEDKSHGIGDVIWFFLFASIILSPFVFIYGVGNLSQVLVYVLLLGVLSTGLAYLLYNLALEHVEAEIGSIIATIITPLISIVLAFMIINESINLKTIIGGALLIIAGVYLETHNKRLKKTKKHKFVT